MWAIQATRKVKVEQWESFVHLPLFYLDETIQGIKDAAHAEQIVRTIIPDAYSVSCTKV